MRKAESTISPAPDDGGDDDDDDDPIFLRCQGFSVCPSAPQNKTGRGRRDTGESPHPFFAPKLWRSRAGGTDS